MTQTSTRSVISQYDPPHPGEAILMSYIEDGGLSVSGLARALGVSHSTLSRILAGRARITAEMAIRLEIVLGPSAAMWLRMQAAFDEWHARQHLDTTNLYHLELATA